ncbi:MAG TPA: N-acetylmuramic acid 6-phosphate etherase [Fimbriiglobus sp.]|jgi:N-acetylmuramic acid 6-phosphate etherase
MDPLAQLQTEARNPASARLDELTSVEIVDLMVKEDGTIPAAVGTQRQPIAQAIDAIADRLGKGGRLVYAGAGTSGRLGVLDASECPPTFQSPPEQVIGLIAGGERAMFRAVEGAEDSPEQGEADLAALKLTSNDVVCGIATSGRTPYVIGAVRYARRVGAFTLGLACTPDAELSAEVDLPIVPVVGPEILTGSTRLKAGTATKLVLNMLTTGAMVRLGKTFGNLMIDLKASNRKLKARANRIVRTAAGASFDEAERLLKDCDGEVKTAIVAHLGGVAPLEARSRLMAAGGRVKVAVGDVGRPVVAAGDVTTRSHRPDLVLGLDGGGTTTICLLANSDTGDVIGRGVGGPSNIQAVGVENGLKALDEAIDRSFQAAGIPRATVAGACLGLAGVDRQEGLDVIHGWAARVALADKTTVANDATLLLAAGTPEGWGLAVIAGTGSIAFVRTPNGEVGRCGGWGYLLGDEGSAYMVALTALRAACRAVDKVGPPTVLVDRFVQRMALAAPPDLIPAVYRGAWDRTAIASLAPMVLDAGEEGDAVAAGIIDHETRELARTAAGAAKNIGLTSGVPVALAGGVLLHSELFRTKFLGAMTVLGITPGPVQLVNDPAAGAVVLATKSISSPSRS